MLLLLLKKQDFFANNNMKMSIFIENVFYYSCVFITVQRFHEFLQQGSKCYIK